MLIPTNNRLTPYEQKEWTSHFETWFRNLSEHTAAAYASDWRQFWELCPKHPSDITTHDIQDFVDVMKDNQLQETTIARKLYSISSFYTFAKQKGIRLDNPCEDVHKPDIPPYIRAKWISFDQAKELLAMLYADETFRGKRDYALCAMLLTTANRRMSIASFERGENYYMKLEQLWQNGDTYTLSYPLKGSGSRNVTLAVEVANALNRYFEVKPLTDAVFCHWDGSPLLVHDVNRIVKEWGKRFGVDLTPTALQRQCILSMVKDGNFENMSQLLYKWRELDRDTQEKIGMSLAKDLLGITPENAK